MGMFDFGTKRKKSKLKKLPKWPKGLKARVNKKKRAKEREQEIAKRKAEIKKAQAFVNG